MAEVLEIEEPQQIPQPEDPPRKKLYKGLVKKGLYTKSYEDFEGQFRTPESIDKLYKGMYDKGLYTKTRDDFNSQFFSDNLKKKVGRIGLEESSLQAGNSLSTGVGSEEIPTIEMYTTPSGEMVETDPISISKKYKELTERKTNRELDLGLGQKIQDVSLVPDEAAQKEAKKLKEDFPDLDLEGISEETKDLNDELISRHGKRLMQERKENPQLYQRDMANLKWRSGFERQLLDEVDKGNIDPDNYNRIKHSIDTLPEFTGQGDYSNQRLSIQSLSKDIQLYGGENKEQLLKDFAVEVSKVYGNAYNNKFSETVKDTPESKYFNEDAQLGYNYLQDVAPEKADQYKRLLIDPKTLKDKSDEQKGYNHLMQTLEETGIGLQQNSVSEELNNLKAIAERNNGLTPEQIQKATDLEKKQDELNQKKDELDKKYPDRITNKVADAVNEIMGHDLNWGEYAMVKTGQAFKNTGEGIWEMVSSPFMSDASTNLRELAIMGENITSETNLKQPDKNKSLLYDKFIIEPDLQKQADEIKSDKGLNDEQKRSKLFSLFYNNRDKFGRVPIQNGKFNINPSSILYGVTDLATGLLPFVGIEMATGGIGGTGAAAKFIRTFTAAAATTFHDEYAGALMEGKTQSDAYKSAMASTAINSMAMAGASTPTAIKEMASGMKTSASKIIAQMSEAEIQKVLAKGTPKGLKSFGQSLKERVKATPAMAVQGLKTGAKFEAYMTGANILNDREVNFKQALINTANFGILGAGLGQLGFKSPTQLQKSHGLEFGKNPDEYIEVAKEMKKNGQLNESELNHRVDLIEKYGEAYKTLPKSLDEKRKAEYLYQTVIKNEANKGKSDLPPKQAADAEHTANVADYKREIVLDGTSDAQLEKNLKSVEKKLEPKKDTEGKVIEIPENELKEHRALRDAIKETLEEREKEPTPTDVKKENVEASTVSGVEGGDVVKKTKLTLSGKFANTDSADNSVKEIYELGERNEFNDKQVVIDGVKVNAERDGGKIWLKEISAIEQGKGAGTKVLKQIQDIADKNDVDIVLHPTKIKNTPEEQLIKWYKDNGFEDYTQGRLIYKSKSREVQNENTTGLVPRTGETKSANPSLEEIGDARTSPEQSTKVEEQTKPTVNEEAIVSLEKERDAEIDKVIKPDLSLQFVEQTHPKLDELTGKKRMVKSKSRVTEKDETRRDIQNDLIKRSKRLEALIKCL